MDTENQNLRRRDPAFFVSDARIAAEECAQKMQDHGPLHPSMEIDLAQQIADLIAEWFADNVWDDCDGGMDGPDGY